MRLRPRRMAIIGTGNIARAHAMACADLPGVELWAACDVDGDKAKAFAAMWAMPMHMDTVEELLRAGPDVVAICTPHPSHPALIQAAAAAGIDCMVEKPLSVDLASAREAVAAVERAGTRMGVIFQRRYWPAARRLKDRITEGRLGRIVQAECVVHYSRTMAYFSPERSPWRGKWATEGGGVTVNHASHALDMLQWLAGPFGSLYACWDNKAHPTIEVDTMVSATATLASGGLASISFGLNPRQTDKGYFELTVYGDNGAWANVREEPEGAFGLNTVWEIPGEEDEMRALTDRERALDRRMYRIVDNGRRPPDLDPTCYRAQYADFFAYLDGSPGYDLTGHEGLKSVELIEAIYRSARQRAPVFWPLDESLSSGEAVP
jgi:UDP-N-acetyl-2-amino-2-deoxyglucuronate dehydrogenase